MLFDIEAPDYDEARIFMTVREALGTAMRSETKARAFFERGAVSSIRPRRRAFEELKWKEIEHQQLAEGKSDKLGPPRTIRRSRGLLRRPRQPLTWEPSMSTYITDDRIKLRGLRARVSEPGHHGGRGDLRDANLCTECVGFHGTECQAVCPVECCLPDPNNPETEDVLHAARRRPAPGRGSPRSTRSTRRTALSAPSSRRTARP
ncbi:MAG: hypothetical protein R3B82_05480 [Sandaracinaceae bacterium]